MPFPFKPRYVELVEEDQLLIITFNRPKALNSMPRAMHAELSKVFRYFDDHLTLGVAIVTGKGKAFSAGFDLKSAAGLAPPEDTTIDTETGIRLTGPEDTLGVPGGSGFGGLTERRGVKPVIAAVNGIAHGGGFETALAKVGLVAAAGGVVRLCRLVGHQNGMELVLTGRRIKAAEAKNLGICQAVVPGGNTEVLTRAKELAHAILLCSPDSVQATVDVMRGSEERGLSAIASIRESPSFPAMRRLADGENKYEGPLAFSEKRKPNWHKVKSLAPYMTPAAKL